MALFPNSTHILQPMDVAVFRPLKHAWKNEVQNWRMENSGNKLQKHNFGPVFKKSIAQISEKIIINGFRCSGLCPFNVENVNFAKISKNKTLSSPKFIGIDSEILLKGIESKIGEKKVTEFKRYLATNDECVVEDTSLFKLWKSVTEDVLERKKGKNIEQNQERNALNEEEEYIEQNQERNTLNEEKENVEPNQERNTLNEEEENIEQNQERNTLDKEKEMQVQFISPIKSTTRSTQTPNKDVSTKSFPLDVPSPFKRALFWPNTSHITKKRKSKE